MFYECFAVEAVDCWWQLIIDLWPQYERQRYDGWYNNLAHPGWGSVDSHLTRKTPPSYEDGVYMMSGGDRSVDWNHHIAQYWASHCYTWTDSDQDLISLQTQSSRPEPSIHERSRRVGIPQKQNCNANILRTGRRHFSLPRRIVVVILIFCLVSIVAMGWSQNCQAGIFSKSNIWPRCRWGAMSMSWII